MARRPVELCRAAAPARQGPRVVRDRGAHGVMVDVEGGGDGADLPVFAEIESANLGVLFGRAHGGPAGTRDGSASTVEGATRSRGHRPYSAARPPGARSANDPSTCQRGVCGVGPDGGKSDPSGARDTRADDRDDRGVLPDSADVDGARRRSSGAGRRRDRRARNTPGRDRTTGRSRTGAGRTGRFAGEAACPRCRSGNTSDCTHTANRGTRETTARSVGASRRSPRVWRYQLQTLTSAWSRTSAYATLRTITQSTEAMDAVACACQEVNLRQTASSAP